MASCITSMWSGSVCPQVKLTVNVDSQNETTATLKYTLEYITHGYTANTNGVARAYTIRIDGKDVKTGSYNIDNKSTSTITTGTCTVNKTTASRSVAFAVSFAFNITWSDVYGGTKSASGSISVGAKTSYTIAYNANGGSGAPATQTKWHGTALTLSSTKPTRTGYAFKGWALTKSDADKGTWYYQPGSSCGRNENTTLYAVWEVNTYTISYNANGGTGTPGNQTKTYGVALTLSSTIPTRTNYTFLGWGTAASATTATYVPGSQYSDNRDITLYAVWKLAYVKPRIKNVTVERCLSNGSPSDDGTYAKLKFNWVCDRQIAKITAQWLNSSGTVESASITPSGLSGSENMVFGGSFDVETSYSIELYVRDVVDYSHAKATLPSKVFPFDVLAGGNGVAIGKAAEHDGIFECGFPARFTGGVDGNLSVNNGGTTSFPDLRFKAYNQGTGIDCNNFKTSGFYGIYGECLNGPKSNLDIGILVVVAYSGDWIYQEFIVPSSGGIVLKYFRTFYMGTTWTEWKKSVHHSYPVASKIAGDGNYSFKIGVMNNPELVWVYQSGGSTTGNKWFAPVTDAAVLLGASNYRWGQIYSTNSTISASDRDQKKDFAEFDKRYEELFAKLKPQLFKFKNGTSDRKHSGFISQDVETAMLEVGLTDKDFAGFCKDVKQDQIGENKETGEVFFENVCDENGAPVYNYSLRYEEFIALNTYMIQKQQSEIETLRNEIQELRKLCSSILPQSDSVECL